MKKNEKNVCLNIAAIAVLSLLSSKLFAVECMLATPPSPELLDNSTGIYSSALPKTKMMRITVDENSGCSPTRSMQYGLLNVTQPTALILPGVEGVGISSKYAAMIMMAYFSKGKLFIRSDDVVSSNGGSVSYGVIKNVELR